MTREADYSEAPGGHGGEYGAALRPAGPVFSRPAREDRRARHAPRAPSWATAVGCFAFLVIGGSALLSAPGILKSGRLATLDAVLLATSAATLTGLTTIPVSDLSAMGQALLLVLFQSAGVAIITVSTLCLAVPGVHHARDSRQIVRPRWVEVEQVPPTRLLRGVALTAFGLETAGALVLFLRLRSVGLQKSAFSAAFLAVSAFCNAGFVPDPTQTAVLSGDAVVLIALMGLASLGGLGYVVLRDIARWIAGSKRSLDLHSRLVLLGTLVLVALAAAFLLLVGSFAPAGTNVRAGGLLDALFRAVNARTAGLALSGGVQSPAVNALTIVLMLVGGAPGSAAGGLKITTVALALLVGLRGLDPTDGSLPLLGRRAPPEALGFAAAFVLRALTLLACAVLLLSVTETLFSRQASPPFGQILFETVSAFTATGLSSGLTPRLSNPGKAVVVLTMLTGRFGLLAMAARIATGRSRRRTREVLRQGEVIIG